MTKKVSKQKEAVKREDVLLKDKKGMTPVGLMSHMETLGRLLFEAADSGNDKKVSELLSAGADVNWRHHVLGDATPLYIAAFQGHESVVSALLSAGAMVNQAMKGGWTPLYIAAQYGHEPVVSALLKKGASVAPRPRPSM